MAAYKTDLGKPDSRGNYKRDLGLKANGKPHRFYLGRDAEEAGRRKNRLEQLWAIIEEKSADGPAIWSDWTLRIGKAIAAGESSCTLPYNRDWFTALAIDATLSNGLSFLDHEDVNELYATFVDGIVADFGRIITILPEDNEAYLQGKHGQSSQRSEVVEFAQYALREKPGSNLLEIDPITLHEALNKYRANIEENFRDSETREVSAWGLAQLQNVDRLKERHDDQPLSEIGLHEIKAMADFWRSRPAKKGSDQPIAPTTVKHHIAQLKNFFWWVHENNNIRWSAPVGLDKIPLTCRLSAQEKQRKVSPAQVQTWSISELVMLYKHATHLERVYILLGLNCGFSVAEFGSLRLDQIFLRQRHGSDALVNYVSNSSQSWIKRVRVKNGVYGEWLLWPHTVQAIDWAIERRKSQPDFSDDAILMLTERGLPYIGQTKGGNHSTRISSLWYEHLLKRVRSHDKTFRKLPPKSLRKTSGNMVRDIADGEVMAIFHARGQAVKTDDLSEVYSNRPFRKVFEALEQLERRLKPMFDAVPEPFLG